MEHCFYEDVREIGDLTIRVRHYADYDCGLDFAMLGEFSDRCGKFKFNPTYKVARSVGTDRDGYCYYNPPYAIEEDRKFYRKAGYSKHESYTMARANALQNLNRLIGLYDGDWGYIGIVVEVLYQDRVVGSDSLWGIESDANDYISEVESELQGNAMAEYVDFVKSIKALK